MTNTPTITSVRIDKALRTAAWAHRNQTRKGTDIPYIVHPFSVMNIAAKATDDEDILVACLFHDILEDAPDEYGREAMAKEFGYEVVAIVEGVTKDDTITNWRDRSEAYLTHLRVASDKSVIVSAADKIHNLQSTLIDHLTHGDQLWSRFNAGKQQQVWWYDSVATILEQRLPLSPLTSQLRRLVEHLREL